MNVHTCIQTHARLSRQDPTKTTVLRRRFERDLVRRFRRLIDEIKTGLVDNDALGLRTNAPMPTFDFPTRQRKVAAFMQWLKRSENELILEVIEGTPIESAAQRAWTKVYLQSAYQRGLAQASATVESQGVEISQRFVDAGFFRPIHADAAGLIYIRAFSDLKGITSAMDAAISRTLSQAMIEGRGMEYTARQIVKQVEGVGIVRARVLARTETIRAHATATLNTYEEIGAKGVSLMSEFSTAGDAAVCPKCEALEGTKYTIEEARGIIPVHPNCRCTWLPVVENPLGLSFQ